MLKSRKTLGSKDIKKMTVSEIRERINFKLDNIKRYKKRIAEFNGYIKNSNSELTLLNKQLLGKVNELKKKQLTNTSALKKAEKKIKKNITNAKGKSKSPSKGKIPTVAIIKSVLNRKEIKYKNSLKKEALWNIVKRNNLVRECKSLSK